MSAKPEPTIVESVKKAVDQNTLSDDVHVVYRLAGGLPHERIDEVIKLSGTGALQWSKHDAQHLPTALKSSTRLESAQTREVFREVAAGIKSLVPRSEARFLPDTVVGSITIVVSDHEETFYFEPDSNGRITPYRMIASDIVAAIDRLKGIAQQLERERTGGDNAL
jgi:hypothetical protein